MIKLYAKYKLKLKLYIPKHGLYIVKLKDENGMSPLLLSRMIILIREQNRDNENTFNFYE